MLSFDHKFDSMIIPLKDIETATNNFDDKNLITHRGSSKIYKGKLVWCGKLIDIVARKLRFWRTSRELETEIMMLTSLKHQNLVSIIGFCDDYRHEIIIYKFEANGSLDRYLTNPTLTWTQRLRICIDVAHALSYIHYDKEHNFSVIHGNLKSSKILLNDKWEAKLSGFELSMRQAADRRQNVILEQRLGGTYAYVDPERLTSGGVTSHKSDVYSLGVILFEVMCGRQAFIPDMLDAVSEVDKIEGQKAESTKQQFSVDQIVENHEGQSAKLHSNDGSLDVDYQAEKVEIVEPLEKEYSLEELCMSTYNFLQLLINIREEYALSLEDRLLSKLAKSHYESQRLDDIIHPDLRNQMDERSLEKFSEAAYHCLNEQQAQRPHIDRVILALKQALEFQLQYEDSLTLKENSTVGSKLKDLEHLNIQLHDINKATDNFSEKYLIGKGGYGFVYKAELEHFDAYVMKGNKDFELPKRRSIVAIKDIINRQDKQGEQGFLAEIETLSSCKHPNIVSLLGFCYEHPRMILVYEHVSNGSLEDYLRNDGKMTHLSWVRRLKICIDIARGLDYIHTTMDNKHKIIHRDIKSANILLGTNWEAKIADFGLSVFHPLNHPESTINLTKVAGTEVYWDPEYERTGNLKKESDIYSFGVVLFEILTGKLAYEFVTKENEKGLAPIVRRHFEKETLINEMLDPKLKEESISILNKGPNKDSLHIFSKIGYQCLSEKQKQRPTMKTIIKELEEALKAQETHKDGLSISFEDIKQGTQDFSHNNLIKESVNSIEYRGEILRDNKPTLIVAKRYDKTPSTEKRNFWTELEILTEYKHENIISLVGYCDESNERISVTEYAFNGSLDMHLCNASLTWTKRLKIAIDVATGLDFLHRGRSTQAHVIHGSINAFNILLTDDWKAKITNLGSSMITIEGDDIHYVVDENYGTPVYVALKGHLDRTRESDIFSLGVVLFEIMRGEIDYNVVDLIMILVRAPHLFGKNDRIVFEDIKDKIVPESLSTYINIMCQCFNKEREKRPKASDVVLQLKRALDIQEDIEIWEAKLPRDYKEIINMSRNPEIYSNASNKDLCEMFSEGILIQNEKVCLSVASNGERNEMVSATMFSYENNKLNKRLSVQNSRFKRVVKVVDILNLKTKIYIKTQFLSPDVIYGAHLVFKFCDRKNISSNIIYVNLKYQMGSEIVNAYFAKCIDNEWMMIELCRFIPHKKDVEFKVLLESLSKYYCGSGAIYVEGIHFRAIGDTTLKVHEADEKLGVHRNSNSVQQVSLDYDERTPLEDDEKIFLLSKANDKKCHMLPARMILHDSSNVKCFNWRSLVDSRFPEVVEVLSNQLFRIKCKIESQNLSSDTNYACYLVFKLSEQCRGLHCPVKVQDVLLRKNKEFKFLYFRSPRLVNLHGNGRVPKLREDGLMEVIVWESNSGKTWSDGSHLPMSLKLRCYEGTMSGLIIYGVEFRPV